MTTKRDGALRSCAHDCGQRPCSCLPAASESLCPCPQRCCVSARSEPVLLGPAVLAGDTAHEHLALGTGGCCSDAKGSPGSSSACPAARAQKHLWSWTAWPCCPPRWLPRRPCDVTAPCVSSPPASLWPGGRWAATTDPGYSGAGCFTRSSGATCCISPVLFVYL